MYNNYPTDLVVECPHCKEPVLIKKLNCCIFRHGVLKKNGKQIDAHAPKNLCDFYIKKCLIFGCGKPFQIVKNQENEYKTIVCGYI